MACSKHDRAKYRPHPIIMELAILAQFDPRTPQQLAEADGISRRTWSNWITGECSPSLDHLAVRAATLGRKIMLHSVDTGLDKPK